MTQNKKPSENSSITKTDTLGVQSTLTYNKVCKLHPNEAYKLSCYSIPTNKVNELQKSSDESRLYMLQKHGKLIKSNGENCNTKLAIISNTGEIINDIKPFLDNKARICPVDCSVSDWSPWSKCSKDCETGFKTRSRTVTTQPAHGGKACPHLGEEHTCNVKPCPIDCKMSEWKNVTDCRDANFQPVRCGGGGFIKQKRHIVNKAYYGGKPCETQLERSVPCSSNDACIFKAMADGAQCPKGYRPATSVECRDDLLAENNLVKIGAKHLTSREGGGWRTNVPYGCSISTITSGGWSLHTNRLNWNGNPAGQSNLGFRRVCRKREKPINCELNEWSNWTDTSDGKSQVRVRTVKKPGAFGGKVCPEENSKERRQVEAKVDCKLGDWTKWQDTPDGKMKSRTRTIITNAAYGGKACPPKSLMTQTVSKEGWPYKKVSKGTCESNILNLKKITDSQECKNAGYSLGILQSNNLAQPGPLGFRRKTNWLNQSYRSMLQPGCIVNDKYELRGRDAKGRLVLNDKGQVVRSNVVVSSNVSLNMGGSNQRDCSGSNNYGWSDHCICKYE